MVPRELVHVLSFCQRLIPSRRKHTLEPDEDGELEFLRLGSMQALNELMIHRDPKYTRRTHRALHTGPITFKEDIADAHENPSRLSMWR